MALTSATMCVRRNWSATQKLVLELIRENPHAHESHIVNTIGKDQGQVAKAINRLIELGLIVKKGVQLSAQ